MGGAKRYPSIAVCRRWVSRRAQPILRFPLRVRQSWCRAGGPSSRSGSGRRSSIAPPSNARLLSSVMAVTGARWSVSASVESKTAGAPFAPSTAGAEDQVELVNQSGAQKGAVGAAPLLRAGDASRRVRDGGCPRTRARSSSGLAGEEVGYALAAQAGEVRVRNPPRSERPRSDRRRYPNGPRRSCRARPAPRRRPSRRGARTRVRAENDACVDAGYGLPLANSWPVTRPTSQASPASSSCTRSKSSPAAPLGRHRLWSVRTVHAGGHQADEVRFHGKPLNLFQDIAHRRPCPTMSRPSVQRADSAAVAAAPLIHQMTAP